MRIETIKIQNYKALKNVAMYEVPKFCVIVGANGTGKTTLFDIFGFLKDCLNRNVSRALQARGGFKEVITRNTQLTESIHIELQLRIEITGVERLVTYILEIGQKNNKAIVKREILRYKRGKAGKPFHFLDFANGSGEAVNNEEDFNKQDAELTREQQQLDSPDMLAIKGVGQFQRFKAANAFRKLIENWYVSDFHINLARGSKDVTGVDEHLSVSGDNLQLVANNLYENHRNTFNSIIKQMKSRIPGIGIIEPESTADGRLLLKFKDGTFKDPFIDKYVSDGTLKMFAYLVLLNMPDVRPLVCIEEPENQLYPTLLEELAEEFESYADRGGQVFVSTHSPDFLNAVGIDHVYWLEKKQGLTAVTPAKNNAQLVTYMQNGDKMGYLWKQGFFDSINP